MRHLWDAAASLLHPWCRNTETGATECSAQLSQSKLPKKFRGLIHRFTALSVFRGSIGSLSWFSNNEMSHIYSFFWQKQNYIWSSDQIFWADCESDWEINHRLVASLHMVWILESWLWNDFTTDSDSCGMFACGEKYSSKKSLPSPSSPWSWEWWAAV